MADAFRSGGPRRAERARLVALLEAIWAIPSGTRSFDPYRQRCSRHDLVNAAEIRRDNLTRYLEAMLTARPAQVWIAEAPGHRGSRRTGVPLVPEPLLGPVSDRLGIEPALAKATTTDAMSVRTANAVWLEVAERDAPPLLWNAMLHHPHRSDDPFTNRSPAAGERRVWVPIMGALLELFQPAVVIAIGRVAESMARAVRPDVRYVRHPSRGGLALFRTHMATSRHHEPAWPGRGQVPPTSGCVRGSG